MNIFKVYSNKIINLVDQNKKKLGINEVNKYKGVTVENPPVEFDYDLSSNICLILSNISSLLIYPATPVDDFSIKAGLCFLFLNVS